jgi:hypothetical protein
VRDLVGSGGDFVHGGDERVQIIFDLVEIAVVGVGDLGGNVAFADPLHVVGGNVERSDDGLEHGVDAANDFRVGALELLGLPRSDSCPSFEASVRRIISFCRLCTTTATLLTACFIFSWSPL